MSDDAALSLRVDRSLDCDEVPVTIPPSREGDNLAQLAELCDATRGSSRDLDARIALAIFPPLRSHRALSPGVWAHPDGSRVRALRYSSSSVAAMTLVPNGHWIECSAAVVGRIEVHGPDEADAVGWGRNDHFPLAAAAAALRARAALARSPNHGLRSVETRPGDSPSPPSIRRGRFDVVLAVWTVLLAVWVAFFGAFWFFSPSNEASALVAVTAILFGLLAFGAPISIDRWAAGIDMNAREKAAIPAGSLRAWAAAVQVVLIPVALVAGLAVFMLAPI